MRRAAVLVVLCCSLLACSGGDPATNKATYADSKADLRRLITDISRAEPEDAKKAASQLLLPDHRDWFVEHFGKELGGKLSADYDKVVGAIGQLGPALRKFRDDGFTKVTVERFDKPDQPQEVVYQHRALEKMKKRSPLYSVRLAKADATRGFHLWSFVYANGGFRWVGKMTAVADGPAGSAEHDKNELRLRDVKEATKSR